MTDAFRCDYCLKFYGDGDERYSITRMVSLVSGQTTGFQAREDICHDCKDRLNRLLRT
jgi:hypothetical protein